MYNVKGPSKIVAKTRRGLVQNLDNLREHTKHIKNPPKEDFYHSPRPVFHAISKRKVNHNNNCIDNQIEVPQHEELVKYINDSWKSIYSESDSNSLDKNHSENSRMSTLYYNDEHTSALDNFQPFDLESWWGKRLFTYITNSVNCTN